MRPLVILKTLAVITVAALSGLAIGTTIAGANRAAREAGVSAPPGGAPEAIVKPDYPSNEAGQTYGRIDQGVWPEYEPDLILVVATNGREGYVSKAALDEATGANVSTLEEALAWEEQRSARPARILLPVYESDGVTDVGYFEVTQSVGTEVVAE